MTKKEVENILKRYPFIVNAIKNDEIQAVFYISKRKEVIEINEQVKTVCSLIELVYEREVDFNIKRIIRGLKSGETDYFLMKETHYTRNSYYDKKYAIIEKIFNLCIMNNLVSEEEILMERIA